MSVICNEGTGRSVDQVKPAVLFGVKPNALFPTNNMFVAGCAGFLPTSLI